MMSTSYSTFVITFVFVAIKLALANGFSPAGTSRRSNAVKTLGVATEAGVADDIDPHVTIGVEPDDLAIGINATEFLEWVGTKNDLTEKMQTDFKSFSQEKVEKEVEKFMMDAEGVNMYIRYLKDKKENPAKYAQQALEAELSLSNPKTLATYAAWLVGGVSFGAIRKEFIDPKFESGEWKAISFELPFSSKPDSIVEAVGSLTSKATNLMSDDITSGIDSLDYFA